MSLGDSIGLLAGVTALLAAGYRYLAVLRVAADAAVERATAIGFFAGLIVGAFTVECATRPKMKGTMRTSNRDLLIGLPVMGLIGFLLGATLGDADPALLLVALCVVAVASAFFFVRPER